MFSIGRRATALVMTLALFFTLLMPFTALGASSQQEGLFAEVNAYRQQNGKSTLKRDADLERRAQAHAEDMAERNYFSHTSPDGTTFAMRIKGYGAAAGENIAAGQRDAVAVVQAWSKSPGHNTNMLNSNHRAMGLGYAYNAQSIYKHYWVLILGSKEVADQPAQPVEEPKAEEPKVEEPKAEEPKVEEPKVEEPKAEEPKPKEPKPVDSIPAPPELVEKPQDGIGYIKPVKPTREELRGKAQQLIRDHIARMLDRRYIVSSFEGIKTCR